MRADYISDNLPGIKLDDVVELVISNPKFYPGKEFAGGVIKKLYPHGILVRKMAREDYYYNTFYTYKDIYFGFYKKSIYQVATDRRRSNDT